MSPDSQVPPRDAARGHSILIIDDDPNNLAIMTDYLEGSSYTILVAEDGESGVKRAVYARPDLILLDVMMPGMDGYETCRELKSMESTRDIPVIFMTALADTEHKVRGFAAGAVDYVTKPFQREEVLARVDVHLRLRELATRLKEANESLERRVEERTLTLARTNEELQKEIHERKIAQEALAVKQGQLENLNLNLEQRVAEEVEKNLQKDRILFHQARLAAMGELLNNIAHQWRQPLNNLGLLIQKAHFEYEEGKLDRESSAISVNRCMEILRYLSNIISAFQSFFRPEGDRREFDPFEVVEKTVSLVRASFEQNGITIRIVNDGTLPIIGYDVEFSHAILHLLNNARDALIQRRTPKPAIDIRCWCENRENVVTVNDNAGGIPEEIADKIFDPYFTTKFQSQGTGIGLYMSKMLIEKNMGGRLSARNTSEGAEFTIRLPV